MSRKQFFIIAMLLFTSLLNAGTQQVGKTTDAPLTIAIREMAAVLANKIPGQVKVVGIGNVTAFAKESTDLSMAMVAFLISQKNFRQVMLLEEDWMLRPLNDYLTDKRAFDSTIVDSLVRISLASSASRTTPLSSFAIWLKKYNLVHPNAMVSLSGIVPDDFISPDYFLATYIFPVDRTNGLIFSKKWGANILDNESSLKDIDTWYQQISKNAILFNKHKKLLLRCAEDLAHNDIVRNSTPLAMKTKTILDFKMHAMANLILKKSDNRAIFYSNNEDIAESHYVFNGDTLVSIGLLLHEQLKDKYYACLTDFADSSSLNQADNQAGEIKLITIPGSMQARELARKKSVFFMQEDSAAIKQYIPRTIFPVIGVEKEILRDHNIPAANALFIIKCVTPIIFLKRIKDIGDWISLIHHQSNE